jgi:Arc/MetJ family transcription regulator
LLALAKRSPPIHHELLHWCRKGGSSITGRTNIEIDDTLVETAMRHTGARTKREVVDIALRRLRGKLAWDGDIEAWRSTRWTRV